MVWGWALTPLPGTVPTDGSTVVEERVVMHHQDTVGRAANVQLDPVRSLLAGGHEGLERVLGVRRRRAAVGQDHGHPTILPFPARRTNTYTWTQRISSYFSSMLKGEPRVSRGRIKLRAAISATSIHT